MHPAANTTPVIELLSYRFRWEASAITKRIARRRTFHERRAEIDIDSRRSLAIYSTSPKSQSARKGFEGDEDRLTMSELGLGRPREQDVVAMGTPRIVSKFSVCKAVSKRDPEL